MIWKREQHSFCHDVIVIEAKLKSDFKFCFFVFQLKAKFNR